MKQEPDRPQLEHEHGDDLSRRWRGIYTKHTHEGGDRPHDHPGNPYINPPPELAREVDE